MDGNIQLMDEERKSCCNRYGEEPSGTFASSRVVAVVRRLRSGGARGCIVQQFQHLVGGVEILGRRPVGDSGKAAAFAGAVVGCQP
jgi:hypothetical protein